MEAHEIWRSHRPRTGDTITYNGVVTGVVSRVEGNLCWTAYADGRKSAPFIWCFKNELNTMHDWPTKSGLLPAGGDPQ